MNLLQTFEAKQIKSASADKTFPQFDAGDTVRIDVLIVDGATERVQAYEGVVIKRKHRGIGSTFTVKKDSNGEGVERTFMLYSPRVQKITVVKRGKVRRAKIYYMRTRTGKSARIEERVTKRKA